MTDSEMEDTGFQIPDLEKQDLAENKLSVPEKKHKHTRRPSITKMKTESYIVNLDDKTKKEMGLEIENKLRKEIIENQQQNVVYGERDSEHSKIYQLGDIEISKEFFSFMLSSLILITILIFIITELSIKNSNDIERERLLNILSLILGVVITKIHTNGAIKK